MPDENVVCPGEELTIEVLNPGSGGTEPCADEYRYSTDNEIIWSAWSTTVPVFNAVSGSNVVQSRRSCESGCTSEPTQESWMVLDITPPSVICQDVIVYLDGNGTASIVPNDVFQSASDNCGTINQVSVLPNTFDCGNLGDNAVMLAINDGNGNTVDCTATVTVNDNINSCAPLPVTLIAFEAIAEKDAIHLVWETTNEYDNAGFYLERSENGLEFKVIKFVEPASTTTEMHTYHFRDQAVRTGQMYFYRLKQIDYDGKYTYSDIVRAIISNGKLVLDPISPNPTAPNNSIQISLSVPKESKVIITLFDFRGITVLTERQNLTAGFQTFQMQINELPASTYFIKIEANGESVYRKLIIGQ